MRASAPRLRIELAVGYFEQGQTTVALDEIKQALATDPTFADAYNLRGLIYMRLDDAGAGRRQLPPRDRARIRASRTRCTTTAGCCASRAATAMQPRSSSPALASADLRASAPRP